MLTPYLMIGMPGPAELIIILIIGLLIFGKRLPEIARNLGKGVVEFKRGIRGIEDDVHDAEYQQPASKPLYDDKQAEGDSGTRGSQQQD